MMVQIRGRQAIKLGKELRMSQSPTQPQTQEQRVQEFIAEFQQLLARDVSHPALAPARRWLDRHLPAELRRIPLPEAAS